AKQSLIEFAIALSDFVLLVFQQLLQVFRVFLYGVGKIGELKRQDLSIGKPHHRSSDGLRQRTSVNERCVGKMRVPVEIVVNRVVDAAMVLAIVGKIQAGNT